MIYPEGLMHRKINIWFSLSIIITIAILAAWAISVRAFIPSFGGLVTKVTPCILDTPPPPGTPVTCAASCSLCTSIMGPACAGSIEIVFTPHGGAYNFICPVKGYLFKRGSVPTPGSFILGSGLQTSPLQSW